MVKNKKWFKYNVVKNKLLMVDCSYEEALKQAQEHRKLINLIDSLPWTGR
jgi:hypothetical protein